jgi:ABC-type Fe3+ transport system substrate-binding protein
MKNAFFLAAAYLMAASLEAVSLFAAAAPSAPMLKAKKEAEANGYIFYANHDEIVSRAKKEGKVRIFSGQDTKSLKAMTEAFKIKYPFIDVRADGIDGTEIYQRMLQEMKAGLAKWDVNYVAADFYDDYLSLQKKFDMLGMAQHGVLKMSPRMIDPVNRHIVALQSNIQVIAYNKEVIAPDKVPTTWEDFLKPEFKDKKLGTDVRPKNIAALVPAWGLEKTLDYARKLAAQNPIWLRGDAQIVTYLMTGQFAIALAPNYKTIERVKPKDVKGVLGYKVVEPIPTRLSETEAILASAENPHAALLWLELQASSEGQKILDKIDLAASIYSSGSVHGRLTQGKNVSLLAWEHYLKMEQYEQDIVKAFGFPRAERSK